MKTILASFVAALLLVSSAQAVVITCVDEGGSIVRIDYDAGGEAVLPIAFALDITVDNGATIENIYDYKVGDSTATSPGYGIFPSSIQLDESGAVSDWGRPDINTAYSPSALPGIGTSGVTIGMASRYGGGENAPLVRSSLCRILVNTHGAETVNVSVSPNVFAGGVVLENAQTAGVISNGITLGLPGGGGGGGDTNEPGEPNIPGGGTDIFQQDSGSNGLVVIEAEMFNNKVSNSGHSWNLVTSPTGFSGTGAMRAEPDNGTTIDRYYTSRSPRLDFNVNFVKTGRHYIWVRCRTAGGNDNSLHAGLNGQATGSSNRISTGTYNRWVWTSRTLDDSSRATLYIGQPGLRTLNIWMREDGLRVDKIILTTNSSYRPTDGSTYDGYRRDDDDDDEHDDD